MIKNTYRNLKSKLKNKVAVPNKPHSLPMRIFDPNSEKQTWEDWKAYSKQLYPVRYFISESVPSFIRVKFLRNIEEFNYWIKSFLIRKDHLLDLRGAPFLNECGEYKWGYIDPDYTLERAIISVFEKYVKEIDDVDGGIEAKIKFLESDGIYNEWLNHFYEVREIDKFIKEEYPKLINKVKSSSYTESNNYEQELDEKINDILIRIVKIRKMMWT